MDTEKARMGLRNNQRSKQLYRASYPPNHCNPDRPRRIPDGKTEIRVVGALGTDAFACSVRSLPDVPACRRNYVSTLVENIVSDDMLARLAEIVHYMQKRQYQRANDAYLRLSIGNAPWPIGVTMVGWV